jgi:hypothetical protein
MHEMLRLGLPITPGGGHIFLELFLPGRPTPGKFERHQADHPGHPGHLPAGRHVEGVPTFNPSRPCKQDPRSPEPSSRLCDLAGKPCLCADSQHPRSRSHAHQENRLTRAATIP